MAGPFGSRIQLVWGEEPRFKYTRWKHHAGPNFDLYKQLTFVVWATNIIEHRKGKQLHK